jgi:hypothetical protein
MPPEIKCLKAMTSNGYNWETEFITADDLMIHTFSERVKVVTHIKNGTIKVFKDDQVIIKRDDMQLSEYEKFLLRIAEDTETLKQFPHD